MLPNKETLTIEFKSDVKGLPDTELIDSVVGMANTDGGSLYLGVEDNGEVTGVQHKHADPVGVSALIANKTIPSLSVRAELINQGLCEVLRIDIPMSRAIVATTEGKILRRRLKLDGTPENIPMYPYEISSRLSELSLLDYSSQILNDATVEDLDQNERLRLRKIIEQMRGEATLLNLNDEELDKALRIVREDNGVLKPTVTGMLLIGKEKRIEELIPTAKSSFQVLEGTKVRINEQWSKPLLACFEIYEEYLKAWNPEREIEYGLLRMPIPEFSHASFREGLVNAFVHRDYTLLQRIRVLIEDEGMTISSPGGFIDGVNLENLLTVEPHGRNPALADALKRIGLAERTGRGIDRIYEGSIIYGRPWPDYSESTERYVKLFIQRAKPDDSFTKMIRNEEIKQGRALPINSLLILSVIQQQKRATIDDLILFIHVSESRIKANVENLIESGLVESSGYGKTRSYTLSSKVYKAQNNIMGYVKKNGIDDLKNEALVIKLAEKQDGYVTREDVMELLNLNDSQAYRVLKKIANANKVELIGKGRSARYRVVGNGEEV